MRTLVEGNVVGTYRLLRLLGGSSNRTPVWLAQKYEERPNLAGPGASSRMVPIGRNVVLKALPNDSSESSVKDQYTIGQAVHHPNVAALIDADVDGELSYIVLEYVDGSTIEQLIRRAAPPGGGLPYSAALDIAIATCAGLAAIHEATDERGVGLGIVHRDIKPSNIMVARSGEVKIIDLGIARSRVTGARTQWGNVRGTPSYMCPEHFRAEQPLPHWDLHALGLVLAEMLVGAPLVPEVDADLVYPLKSSPELRSRIEARRPLLGEVFDVVARCASPKGADRPQSAQGLLRELRELRSRLPVSPGLPELCALSERRHATLPAGDLQWQETRRILSSPYRPDLSRFAPAPTDAASTGVSAPPSPAEPASSRRPSPRLPEPAPSRPAPPVALDRASPQVAPPAASELTPGPLTKPAPTTTVVASRELPPPSVPSPTRERPPFRPSTVERTAPEPQPSPPHPPRPEEPRPIPPHSPRSEEPRPIPPHSPRSEEPRPIPPNSPRPADPRRTPDPPPRPTDAPRPGDSAPPLDPPRASNPPTPQDPPPNQVSPTPPAPVQVPVAASLVVAVGLALAAACAVSALIVGPPLLAAHSEAPADVKTEPPQADTPASPAPVPNPCPDLDGDGFASCSVDGAPVDCDDTRPDVYPGAPERCDGYASGCQSAPPEDEVDADGDGYVRCVPVDPAGGTLKGGDCDEGDRAVHPGATDPTKDCDPSTAIRAGIPAPKGDLDRDGATVKEGDCNDNDAAIGPRAKEIVADGLDQNCDGMDLCYLDRDGDGAGAEVGNALLAAGGCTGNGFSAQAGDCDDGNPALKKSTPEVCTDGVDNDCDRKADGSDSNCQTHFAGLTAKKSTANYKKKVLKVSVDIPGSTSCGTVKLKGSRGVTEVPETIVSPNAGHDQDNWRFELDMTSYTWLSYYFECCPALGCQRVKSASPDGYEMWVR